VEFIHPIVLDLVEAGDAVVNFPRFPDSYASVQDTMLTLFQTIICGDSWGSYSLPMIKHSPATLVIFVPAVFTILLGLLNLVTAVVVETAAQQPRSKRQRDEQIAKRRLVQQCRRMDSDASGTISLKELHEESKNVPEFQEALNVMNITTDDLACVFEVMDVDKSGTVSYREFADEIYKMKKQDPATMLKFIKHYVVDIENAVRDELGKLISMHKSDLDGIAEVEGEIKRQEGLLRSATAQIASEVEGEIKRQDCLIKEIAGPLNLVGAVDNYISGTVPAGLGNRRIAEGAQPFVGFDLDGALKEILFEVRRLSDPLIGSGWRDANTTRVDCVSMPGDKSRGPLPQSHWQLSRAATLAAELSGILSILDCTAVAKDIRGAGEDLKSKPSDNGRDKRTFAFSRV